MVIIKTLDLQVVLTSFCIPLNGLRFLGSLRILLVSVRGFILTVLEATFLVVSYFPACSEIPISGGFNYGTALRTEKQQRSSRDLHFLLPGFWKPTQLGLQFKMRCVLWVCGQQVACRRTEAPSGLGVLCATLTPGDHAGSDRVDGPRRPVALGWPRRPVWVLAALWVSPTLGLAPALHSLQGHGC